MNIGDLFFAARVDSARLEPEAAKIGDAAGKTMGEHMAAAIGKGKFGASIVQGFGIGVGVGAFHALEDAIGDVVSAIPDMIHSGQAFGLTVDEITDKTGASAEAASRLAGTLTYLGIPTAGLGMALRTLSQDIVNNEEKLTGLGIVTRDSNGNLLDTVTILDSVRSYMSKTTNGAADLTLATDLLGRGAGTLVDYLALTDSQVQSLNGTLDDMGVTMDKVAVKNAESLMRETNLLSLAFQGFSNMLFTEVAPTIRQVIGGITEFIKTHGEEIRATIVSMTQAVLGFVTGLLGVSGITPFQSQLDGLEGSAGNVTLSMEQWAQQTGRTIPAIDKVKTSTKGATDAIDAQIKSVDKQIERSKARDAADETIFQRTMKRLSGEYGARIDALDLAEREMAIAADQRDLNEQLNAAQLALAEAQKGKGSGVDAQAVSDAMAAVSDIQAKQAENARKLTVDTNRARLQSTQDYIDSVAALEASADDKKSLANTLAKRDTVLTGQLAVATEAKSADQIADITAKLEAVKTAEARTAVALKEGAKQTELDRLKAQLADQRAAVAAAGSGEVSDNAKKLADLQAAYKVYQADQLTQTQTHSDLMGVSIMGNPTKGTGLGGGISKAFADGQLAAEGFKTFISETLGPAIQTILDTFGAIRDVIVEIADYSDTIGDLLKIVTMGGTGSLTQPSPADVPKINRAIVKFTADYKAGNVTGRGPSDAEIKQYLHDQGFPGFAKGAWNIPQNMIGGLDKGEMVVPRSFADMFRDMTAGPAMALGGASAGAITIEVPVSIDGQVITRVVARRLANEYGG